MLRRYICRQGEFGYDVGKGGWGLPKTKAEGLRERWSEVIPLSSHLLCCRVPLCISMSDTHTQMCVLAGVAAQLAVA